MTSVDTTPFLDVDEVVPSPSRGPENPSASTVIPPVLISHPREAHLSLSQNALFCATEWKVPDEAIPWLLRRTSPVALTHTLYDPVRRVLVRVGSTGSNQAPSLAPPSFLPGDEIELTELTASRAPRPSDEAVRVDPVDASPPVSSTPLRLPSKQWRTRWRAWWRALWSPPYSETRSNTPETPDLLPSSRTLYQLYYQDRRRWYDSSCTKVLIGCLIGLWCVVLLQSVPAILCASFLSRQFLADASFVTALFPYWYPPPIVANGTSVWHALTWTTNTSEPYNPSFIHLLSDDSTTWTAWMQQLQTSVSTLHVNTPSWPADSPPTVAEGPVVIQPVWMETYTITRDAPVSHVPNLSSRVWPGHPMRLTLHRETTHAQSLGTIASDTSCYWDASQWVEATVRGPTFISLAVRNVFRDFPAWWMASLALSWSPVPDIFAPFNISRLANDPTLFPPVEPSLLLQLRAQVFHAPDTWAWSSLPVPSLTQLVRSRYTLAATSRRTRAFRFPDRIGNWPTWQHDTLSDADRALFLDRVTMDDERAWFAIVTSQLLVRAWGDVWTSRTRVSRLSRDQLRALIGLPDYQPRVWSRLEQWLPAWWEQTWASFLYWVGIPYYLEEVRPPLHRCVPASADGPRLVTSVPVADVAHPPTQTQYEWDFNQYRATISLQTNTTVTLNYSQSISIDTWGEVYRSHPSYSGDPVTFASDPVFDWELPEPLLRRDTNDTNGTLASYAQLDLWHTSVEGVAPKVRCLHHTLTNVTQASAHMLARQWLFDTRIPSGYLSTVKNQSVVVCELATQTTPATSLTVWQSAMEGNITAWPVPSPPLSYVPQPAPAPPMNNADTGTPPPVREWTPAWPFGGQPAIRKVPLHILGTPWTWSSVWSGNGIVRYAWTRRRSYLVVAKAPLAYWDETYHWRDTEHLNSPWERYFYEYIQGLKSTQSLDSMMYLPLYLVQETEVSPPEVYINTQVWADLWVTYMPHSTSTLIIMYMLAFYAGVGLWIMSGYHIVVRPLDPPATSTVSNYNQDSLHSDDGEPNNESDVGHTESSVPRVPRVPNESESNQDDMQSETKSMSRVSDDTFYTTV